MKQIIFLLIFLVAFNPIKSQDIIWKDSSKVIDIGQRVSVLEDKLGKLDIAQICDSTYNSKFKISTQSILHFGFTSSVYWVKFSLTNYTKKDLILELDHAFIPYGELFFKDSLNRWVSYKSGCKIPLDQKIIIDRSQAFPLPSGKRVFYIRMLPYVHAIPINIYEKNYWQLKANRQKIIYGLYAIKSKKQFLGFVFYFLP